MAMAEHTDRAGEFTAGRTASLSQGDQWILGIESSCDESALAYFSPDSGQMKEWIFSQMQLHSQFGGVVPDLASREHASRFPHLLRDLVGYVENMPVAVPARIAVTTGPGLAGCLAIGLGLAKSLALAFGCPLVAVNHLSGHAFSPFIPIQRSDPRQFGRNMKDLLPHLGLIVSGGNTILFSIECDLRIRIIGQTVDDAAGEALDKGAKLLGMPYPGGARIELEALAGDVGRHEFPSFAPPDDPRFSFSGLKTSLRYRLEKMSDEELGKELPHLCAAYQSAVFRQLLDRCNRALQSGAFHSLGLSGGVSNNASLRSQMAALAASHSIEYLAAERQHTGDNASMIAFAAWIDPTTSARSDALDIPFNPSGLAGFGE